MELVTDMFEIYEDMGASCVDENAENDADGSENGDEEGSTPTYCFSTQVCDIDSIDDMTADLKALAEGEYKRGVAARIVAIWAEAMADFKALMATDQKCLDKSETCFL